MKSVIQTVLLLALLVLAACSPRTQPTGSDATTEPAAPATDVPATQAADEGSIAGLALTADSEKIEGATSVASGWTAITLTNEDAISRHWMLLKVEEGSTTQDVTDALTENPDVPPSFVQLYGEAFTEPSGEASYSVNLMPGQYLIVSEAESEEESSDSSDAMVHELTVTEESNGMAAPVADAEVEMANFAFIFKDGIEAGEQTILATNTGDEWHHAVIFKVEEGTTMEDLEPWFSDEPPGEGPPPFEEAGGIGILSPGVSAAFTMTLEPGSYIAVCFLPSFSGDGMPHFMKGMVAEFTLQ